MDKIKLIITLGALVAGLVLGWTANGWRLGQTVNMMRADADRAAKDATESARAKEHELNQRLQEAQNNAAKRETTLRTDADRARVAHDRLRDELGRIKRDLPGLAADAYHVRADALADVLGSCTDRYRGMAATCDRIASDRQTLMEAWPK